ncbi:hypothetical protein CAEBREN_28430 [Caenorhabditis brenneri]|uniref:Peptidase M13 N-terminal domain-containing protein n=1 Tax=Caenorhabditis brenneri TaxID=135651 RepID=G0NMV9_CAEBE|nr:hypothetical protein CAEBREN_28430 [Caenorhabditis brenneri]
MSADEKAQSRCLIGSLIIFIILIIALLITAVILKFSDSHLSALSQNSSNPNYSNSLVPSRPELTTAAGLKPTVAPIEPRNVCESKECITLAHQLHNFRDPTVDPCQDFYQFSCGNYIQHTVVEEPVMVRKNEIFVNLIRGMHSVVCSLRLMISDFLVKKRRTTSNSENAMKTLYDKCEEVKNAEDPTTHEKQKWKEAIDMIKKIGSWPILNKNWKESGFNLNNMLTKMSEFGFEKFGFFEIYANADQYLLISPLQSPMKQKHQPGRFKKTLLHIFKISNIKIDAKQLKSDLKDFEKFEDEIAGYPVNYRREFQTLDQLQKQIPSVNFEKIIRSSMNPKKNKNEFWDKVKDRILITDQPLFFNTTKNLETILKTTPKRTLANFLIFRLIDLMITQPDNYCEEVVLDRLPLASLRVFVRNHFDKENLKIASDLVEDLRQSFKDSFQQSTWLHEETKKKAIEKLEMMRKMIGYPEELEKPGALDKIFETLQISPSDSYHTMHIKIGRFQMEQAMEFVAGSTKILADMRVLWANAAYFFNSNFLGVNALLLDDPMFDSTYPKYAKIASAGRVIGHEIGHGFDPLNRRKDGNGKENDWWTPEDSNEYDKRVQCLVEKYDNFDHPLYGKKFNGTTALREISADVMGNDMAWRTYKRLDMSNEPKIIGFEKESTDKVYFYISALV